MSIFKRVRLEPSQMREAARRRHADAWFLVRTGDNCRANAAMYLGGFVLECLLKARLVESYSWALKNVASPQPELWSLVYRSHDLGEMLSRLPAVERQMHRHDREYGTAVLNTLKQLCGQWTVFARYSPQAATIAQAKEFMRKVTEVKRWLE